MNVLTQKVRFPAFGDVKWQWSPRRKTLPRHFVRSYPVFHDHDKGLAETRFFWPISTSSFIYFSVKGEGKDFRSERGVKSASAAWGIIFTTPGWGWQWHWPSPKTFWLVPLGVELFPVLSSSSKARRLYLSGCLLWWVAPGQCAKGRAFASDLSKKKGAHPLTLATRPPPRPSQPCWALVNSGSVTVLALYWLSSGRKYTEKHTLSRQNNAHSHNCSNLIIYNAQKKVHICDKMCFNFQTRKGSKQSLSCSVTVILMLGCKAS